MAKVSLRQYKTSLSERFRAINMVCDKILATTSKKRVPRVTFHEDIEYLNKLVSGDKPSAAYKTQETQIVKGLTETLSRKFNLEALATKWPEMPDNEKKSLLKRILKVQANLQSTQQIKVKPARLEIKSMTSCGSMYYKIEDKQGKKDRIIIADRLFRNSLPETLNTLTHEQTHTYQATLARAVSFKQIHHNNALYRDGLYFLLKDKHNAYVCSAIDEPYMRQRDEVDAYFVGDTIGEFAAKFEAKEEQEEKVTRPASKKAPQWTVPA